VVLAPAEHSGVTGAQDTDEVPSNTKTFCSFALGVRLRIHPTRSPHRLASCSIEACPSASGRPLRWCPVV